MMLKKQRAEMAPAIERAETRRRGHENALCSVRRIAAGGGPERFMITSQLDDNHDDTRKANQLNA